MDGSQTTAWQPELAYINGQFQAGAALTCDSSGQLVGSTETTKAVPLTNRAALPGLINAHSHAFQRVIRGRTEYRTSQTRDSFWTWREMMYSAATRLTPEDIYDASRMAFLEMALSGITAVGEFHYLHHAPDGQPYDDPNLLSKQVIQAARDVGLRIALLRVAYARSGFEAEPNPLQKRFIEKDAETFIRNSAALTADIDRSDENVWTGVAPHSVRAVPLDCLKQVISFANENQLPVHMHVAEQPAEVSACIAEHGRSPVALLETEGLLSERFTAVHAIHVTSKAIAALARASSIVCACPTTERNLGDGVVPVDSYFQHGVRVALGTDSHTQIDLLEDARELEYHLRLQKTERAVLAQNENDGVSALAARLFECATLRGAESIRFNGGALDSGHPADFFTVALDDPSIAGSRSESLLANIVFSQSRTAIRDVIVGGRTIVQDGRHRDQEEIVARFNKLQAKLWS
jgi:formimidoylglutamate deiminase